MNFISREQVLALLDDNRGQTWAVFMRSEIERLPSFPAPNPNQEYDRNVMGQTEDQFWALVDARPNAVSDNGTGPRWFGYEERDGDR